MIEVKTVERYGKEVFESNFDAIRRGNCMCLQCLNMKPGKPDHCSIAAAFYEICKTHGNAFIMTRCDSWKEIV